MHVFINFDKNTAKFKYNFWKTKKLMCFGLQLGPLSYLLVVAPYQVTSTRVGSAEPTGTRATVQGLYASRLTIKGDKMFPLRRFGQGPSYITHRLDIRTKRRRSDSVLWIKPLHQQKCQKGKVTTKTMPQKSSIKQQLRTDLGRSVGVTTATQLVWLTWFTGPPSHSPQQPCNA